MLSDQQVETYILNYQQQITNLQSGQANLLSLVNQLQVSFNQLPAASSSSTGSGLTTLDTYLINGSIVHKIKTLFQAVVTFALPPILSSTTAGFPLRTSGSKQIITGLINITAPGGDVSGNLSVVSLNNGSGASAGTFWRGDGTWNAPPSTIIPIQYGVATFTAGSASVFFSLGAPTSAVAIQLNATTATEFIAASISGSTVTFKSSNVASTSSFFYFIGQ